MLDVSIKKYNQPFFSYNCKNSREKCENLFKVFEKNMNIMLNKYFTIDTCIHRQKVYISLQVVLSMSHTVFNVKHDYEVALKANSV